ncbi:MAG: tagaturonate epimerase family protein [Planctomycetota bacterium]
MPQPSENGPTPLGLEPTFGFGDRLGSATPGHLAALTRVGGPIRGVFAQQSIREMDRTARTPHQVMRAAASALDAAGYHAPWGADADHLKTPADVEATAAAGFTFFTLDPSDHVDPSADDDTPEQIDAKYQPPPWLDDYLGRTVDIPDGPTIAFDEPTLKRAAVKYGRAIAHALDLAGVIQQATRHTPAPPDNPPDTPAATSGGGGEIEISVDETEQPTTLAEHFVIADQLRRGGVNLVSLAPRFVGELEKGVDYLGDLAALEASLRDHAAIAEYLGPYKLSLHSGSDKLSMYPAFARATRGRFHVKTAGTSYLEALRVVARHAPPLFRRIVTFSRDRYDQDRATYHVHATTDSAPPESDVRSDHDLEGLYLGHWPDVPEGEGYAQPGRQILHCTFGSVVTDPDLGLAFRACLDKHPDTYRDLLDDHFGRHLQALRSGMNG